MNIRLVYMLETLHPSITAGYICSLDVILLFSESITRNYHLCLQHENYSVKDFPVVPAGYTERVDKKNQTKPLMKLVAMGTSYNILIRDVFIHQLNIGLLENKK